MSIDEAVAAVDLEYSLAIDHGGSSVEGVYVSPLPTGARIDMDDGRYPVAYDADAAECIRLGTYLLACARKAAGS